MTHDDNAPVGGAALLGEYPPLTHEELERLYAQILSLVPVLARALGKPSPLPSRKERLEARHDRASEPHR